MIRTSPQASNYPKWLSINTSISFILFRHPQLRATVHLTSLLWTYLLLHDPHLQSLRTILLLDFAALSRKAPQMSLMITSASHPRTFTPAAQPSGGILSAVVFPDCIHLLKIFLLYQVCCLFTSCLYILTHDLGSAVAVERVFSSGRDTISLCRASLMPETIRILMIAKQHLKLRREKALNAWNFYNLLSFIFSTSLYGT